MPVVNLCIAIDRFQPLSAVQIHTTIRWHKKVSSKKPLWKTCFHLGTFVFLGKPAVPQVLLQRRSTDDPIKCHQQDISSFTLKVYPARVTSTNVVCNSIGEMLEFKIFRLWYKIIDSKSSPHASVCLLFHNLLWAFESNAATGVNIFDCTGNACKKKKMGKKIKKKNI